MRRCGALLVVASGCGRLGFDPVADAPFGPPQLVVALSNPQDSEEDPSLTGDMLEILFYRNQDLMVSRRATVDAAWPPPQPIAELDSPDGESTPEISPDGLTLLFSSDRAGGPGNADVYASTRASRADPWSPPQLVPELSSPAYDVDANATAAGTFVVLRSERAPGAVGNGDLFSATRPTAQSSWATPRPVAELNSSGDDIGPFFHEPTQTLYFASDRGGGSLDLWQATRLDPGEPFELAEPIPELTTDRRESDPWVSADGNTIYFSANPPGGNPELYMATR